MRYPLIPVMLILLVGAPNIEAQEWRSIGPEQSRPTPVVIDTVNRILYTSSGPELYKSLDRGHSWERLLFPEDSDREPNWNIVRQLVCQGERLYALRTSGPILTTTDQGNSWRELNQTYSSPDTPQVATSIAVLRDTLYMTIETSFTNRDPYFYSTDHGNSWITDAANFSLLNVYASGSTLYGREREHIYRLTSPGKWELFGPDSVITRQVFTLNDYTFAVSYNDFFRFSEQEGTWKRIKHHGYVSLPTSMVIHDDTLFAYYPIGDDGTLYQTHLDGDSLIVKPDRQPEAGNWGWLLNIEGDLTIIGTNSYQWNDELWGWSTINVGNNWKNHGVGLLRYLDDGLYAWAGNEMFLLRNEELGWERLPLLKGKSILSIDTAYGRTYFNVNDYPFVYSTSDGGVTWDSTMFADSTEMTIVKFYIVAGTFYMTERRNDKLFRSLDRGQLWEVIGDFYAGDQVCGNEDVLFYTQFASIYRSFDRGDSWEPINVKGLPRANGSLTSQYQNGYLYLSVVDQQSYYKDEVQTRDTITGSIFRSDDNGETWVGLGTSLPTGLYAGREMRRISNVNVKHDTISLFVRDSTYTNLRLFVSIDRGENWNELEVPQSLMPNKVEFNGADIYLGTLLYSVLQSKLDISSSVPTPGTSPHSSTATLTFDQTKGLISYTLSTPSKVRLALYSIEGREVMTLADEYREVGTYRVQIGSLPLPHGLYLIVLQTGEESVGQLIRGGEK